MDPASITLSSPLRIGMTIKTGATFTSNELRLMGQGNEDFGCGGSLYVYITSNSKFGIGVRCDSRSSDGPLESTTAAAANTEYDLTFFYDGSRASIFVDGNLDAGPTARTFHFFDIASQITGAALP